MMKQALKVFCMGFVLVLLAGCETALHHGLDERAANEIVVVLEQSGISSKKAPDPSSEDGWMVLVNDGVRVEAWRVLETQGLPRAPVKGFGAHYPSGGLVPTAGEELILLQFATSQELSASLMKIDGVVDAQVNLVLPPRAKLLRAGEQAPKPRASVLVKYRPGEDGKAPVQAEHVRELVAGGVQDMEREQVTVILTPASRASQPLKGPMFAKVGPVSVAPGSKVALMGLFGALVLVLLGLSGALGFVLLRQRKGVPL
jgi:type III secretion protein J